MVDQLRGPAEVADIPAFTAAAAHGRDHDHRGGPDCHPHAVEVVYLGLRALTVCHDCRTDSGFVPYREAKRLADVHRDHTLGSLGADVSLAFAETS